ncbi:MAG: glycosyltransferase, partial [Phycisphaerae bacterium]|nr:glycosyltransferase [Phycisphaerae bacterium]
PQVLLIDLGSVAHRLAEVKYFLWKDNGIGCPEGDYEFDECVGFGYAVTEFLMSLQQRIGDRPLLAHFHEWQGAAALPMLRHRNAPLATVFTTHATLVGRALSAAHVDLYDHLHSIDGAAVAREHGFAHRHALEGAAVQSADVFTTVSGITGMEAQQFLGRVPDVLLPNGLNVERFAAPHEFQILHRESRSRIHEFVMGHFFPSYTFDLSRTLYAFTSGRYEYRNKGLDVFIESLAELNHRLKAEASPATIVAFIVTRVPYRALNVETLNRQAMFRELRDTCEAITEDMGKRLFHTVARGQMPSISDLLDEYAAVRLKRMMYAMRQGPPPSIVTHDLVDDGNDPVLRHLRHKGLWNLPEDRVKVLFHPEFMSATSPLLSLDYDQFVRGCHIGVFPSYYEPWGYTPLECVVRGVPAVTSDLSGFGAYVMENFPDHDENGMYVARRRNAGFDTTVRQVTDWLHALTRLTRRERINLRNRVESHAQHFDWNQLNTHYSAAHRLAFERRYLNAQLVPPSPPTEAHTDTTAPSSRRPARSRASKTPRRKSDD